MRGPRRPPDHQRASIDLPRGPLRWLDRNICVSHVVGGDEGGDVLGAARGVTDVIVCTMSLIWTDASPGRVIVCPADSTTPTAAVTVLVASLALRAISLAVAAISSVALATTCRDA
jgi:hypothetical protein